MTIFDRTMQLLSRSLDLRGARQQVIAANIANEETPKYRAKDLNFGQALASAQQGKLPISLVSTNAQHFGPQGTGYQRVRGQLEDVPTPIPSTLNWKWPKCRITLSNTTPQRPSSG